MQQAVDDEKQLDEKYMELIKQGAYKSYECNYVQSDLYYNQAIKLQPLHFRAHFQKASDMMNRQNINSAMRYMEWILANCSLSNVFQIIIRAMMQNVKFKND